MRTKASGKVEIEETSKGYFVARGKDPDDRDVLFYSSKEKAEEQLSEWYEETSNISIVYLRDGDSLSKVHRVTMV